MQVIWVNRIPRVSYLVLAGKKEDPNVSDSSLSSSLPETFRFAVVVEIVKDKDICPNNEAMVPIKGDLYYVYRNVYVY